MAALWSLVLLCGAVLTLHVHCWDCLVAEGDMNLQGWRSNMSFYSMYSELYNRLMVPCRGAGDAPQSTRPTSGNRSRSGSRSPTRRDESRRRSSTSHGTSDREELESACCAMQIMLEFDPSVSLDRFKYMNERWQEAHGGKELIDPLVAFSKLRPAEADIPSKGTPNAIVKPWEKAKRSMTPDWYDIIPHIGYDVESAMNYYIRKSRPSAGNNLDCVLGYAEQLLGLNSEQSFYKQGPKWYDYVMEACPRKDEESDSEDEFPFARGDPSNTEFLDSACCAMQIMLKFNPTESVAVYEYVNKLWQSDHSEGLLDPFVAFNEVTRARFADNEYFPKQLTPPWRWTKQIIEKVTNMFGDQTLQVLIPYIAKKTTNTVNAKDVADALTFYRCATELPASVGAPPPPTSVTDQKARRKLQRYKPYL